MKNSTKQLLNKGLNKRVANDIAPQQKTLPGLDNPRILIMSLFQAEKGKLFLITVSRQFLKLVKNMLLLIAQKFRKMELLL